MSLIINNETYASYIQTLCPPYKKFNQLIADTLKQRTNGAERISIINLGCGIGELERAILKDCPESFELIGVDKDPEALAYLRTRTPQVSTQVSDVQDFDFPETDIYVAALTLHHLEYDWEQTYQRILERTGVFINFEMFMGSEEDFEQIRRNLAPEYSFEEWLEHSRQVDYFRTKDQELDALMDWGYNPEVLEDEKPYTVYIIDTRT